MKMIKIIRCYSFLLFLVLACTSVYNQSLISISLDKCLDGAEKNYSEARQKEFLNEILDLKMKNIQAYWLPKADIFAQATYQSDVISIDPGIPIPGLNFPTQPKDQYKAGVELQQIIYEGGLTRSMKRVEDASTKAQVARIDVNIYKLKEVIVELYFGIIINRSNTEILKFFLDELKDRLAKTESAVKNGIFPESALWQIQIEIHRLQQTINSQSHLEKELISKLSELTGIELVPEIQLEIPVATEISSDTGYRPELEWFSSLQRNLDETAGLKSVSRYPKATAFAHAGYGRPGMNMLSDEFDAYYMVGIRLGWNIYDWKQTKREHQILKIQKQIIESNKELFEQQNRIQINSELESMSLLTENLAEEKRISEFYEKLLVVSESRLNQGVIQPYEYLRDFNALMESRMKTEILEKQLLKSKIMYRYEQGLLR